MKNQDITGQNIRRVLSRETGAQGSSDFDLNKDMVLPVNRKLRPAAVLIPIVERAWGPQLVLTMRSSALKHHPGQIAFPGGKVDRADAGPMEAALREAQEEIGLPQNLVEVVGTLPSHETVTSFDVRPYVGFVSDRFEARPEVGEVEEVFEVPVAHVLNPDNFMVQSRNWMGKDRRYFIVPYGPYYIWGATARMLRSFADLMEYHREN